MITCTGIRCPIGLAFCESSKLGQSLLKEVYTYGDYHWESDHLVADCGAGRICGRTAGQEA